MKQKYQVKGMHCAACELIIEEKLKQLSGVSLVKIDRGNNELTIESKEKISKEKLNKMFRKNGYEFWDLKPTNSPSLNKEKSNWIWLPIGVILGFLLLNSLGLGGLLDINKNSSWVAFLGLGLIAGFSSCGALMGGIILSRPKETLTIILGRILGYSILGIILGVVGQQFKVSGLVMNIFMVAVSIVMIVVALQMVGVSWANKIKIGLPKEMSQKILKKEMAWGVGLLSVFLPCGFTILTESMAMLSGSAISGLVIMFSFVLGTSVPLFLIGKGGEKIIKNQKAIGIIILFFVVYNLVFQLGLRTTLPSLNPPTDSQSWRAGNGGFNTEEVKSVIEAKYTNFGLSPSEITVKKGEKTRLEIEVLVNEYGCMSTILLQGLYEKPQTLTKGKTLVMEFTPTKTGNYQFVCAMDVPHNGQLVVTE
ncbi:MAG: sulfite exporter TauE/SafE family protein [Candidatus Shapirobacteria bacterium]|nr:sulfite exporter TauE/SafE family protein [Candidatus Shapirobacteria bacterium]